MNFLDKNRKLFVLISCCLTQSGVLGIVYNCRGIFFDAICKDLGFSLASLTRFGLFFGIACFISMPFVQKIFKYSKANYIFAFISFIVGSCLYLSSAFNHLNSFYIAALIEGACCAFIYTTTASSIINNWYKNNNGKALGICNACPALTGMLLNPLIANIIDNYGWRSAYRIIGIIFCLLTIPSFLFLIVLKPVENNSSIKQNNGYSFSETIRNYKYYCIALLAGIGGFLTCYSQLLPKYGKTLYFIKESAYLSSLAMLGNLIFKFFIGFYADKKGLKKALYLTSLCLVIGFSLLLIKNNIAVYIGSFLTGTATSLTGIIVPLAMTGIFGRRDYQKKLSYAMMPSTLFSSLGITLYGLVIDLKGYNYSLYMSLVLIMIIIFINYAGVKDVKYD